MQLFRVSLQYSLLLLLYQYALSPFFERFLILAGPEGLDRKTSKLRLNAIRRGISAISPYTGSVILSLFSSS
jgi:hypothetical protein